MARLLPTTAALLLLLVGLAAPAHRAAAAAQADGASIWVEDDFIDAATASQLAGAVPTTGSPTPGSPFSQPVGVPASLYARLLSVFAPAGTEAAADAVDAANEAVEAVVVPARTGRGHVTPHQDRFLAAGGSVAAKAGLVYLAGDGQLAFTHKATGEETVVDLKPGRLITWDNAAFTHSLVAGERERVMLGPMAFKDGGLHEVGDEGGWLTNTQLCVKTLLAKPGSVVKASAQVVPLEYRVVQCRRGRLELFVPGIPIIVKKSGWKRQLSAAAGFKAGQDGFTRASISPNKGKGFSGAKLKPVVAGDAINVTIPAEQLQAMTLYTLSFAYRIPQGAPAGSEITFTLEAGVDGTGHTNTKVVTVVVR